MDDYHLHLLCSRFGIVFGILISITGGMLALVYNSNSLMIVATGGLIVFSFSVVFHPEYRVH